MARYLHSVESVETPTNGTFISASQAKMIPILPPPYLALKDSNHALLNIPTYFWEFWKLKISNVFIRLDHINILSLSMFSSHTFNVNANFRVQQTINITDVECFFYSWKSPILYLEQIMLEDICRRHTFKMITLL